MGVAGASTQAAAVAVDSIGNVYTVGTTTGSLDGATLTGNKDYFLTRYDPAGNKVSTRQDGATGTYTLARSVAADSGGNVYVTGNTDGGLDGNMLTGTSDLFLAMYDPTGNKVRTKQLGVAGADTVAQSVAVDSGGNVYVAGYTAGGLDGNTGVGTYDCFLVKYDPSGNKVGTAKQMGVALADTKAYGVVVDSSGNVYVAGYTSGGLDGNTLTGTKDFFLIKYDPSGNKVGTAKQMGAAAANTVAHGIAVDQSDNVYVAGYTSGGLDGNTLAGTADFFLIKYDPSGNKVGTAKQTGVAGAFAMASGVAADPNGNVYVAGATNGGLDGNTPAGMADVFLIKYDPSGNKVGAVKQTGIAGASTFGTGVAADVSGNVYVTGYTNGGLDGNALTGTSDFFLVKYDPSGTKQ